MILSSLGLYPQARKDLLLGFFPKGLILVVVGLGLYIRNSFSKLSMWDLWFVPNKIASRASHMAKQAKHMLAAI